MLTTPNRILIVGNSFSSQKAYLDSHGFDYIVLKDRRLTKFPDKKFKHRVVCDLSNHDQMLEIVDAIHAQRPITGVLTIYEQFIGAAAEIAQHLGLPALPQAAAEACTDKFIMRHQFAGVPEKISPDFAVITDEQGVRDFAANHAFPLITKPANLSKSLLVSKSNSLDELLANYHKTLDNIERVYKRYAPTATPKLLIEEFMEGSVHSVDAFVDGTGNPFILDAVVDYQTGHDIGYDDNFHYSRILPSRLPASDILAIKHVATLGIKALGMKNTPAHVEIIMTADGPHIVEIGARNGGYRERMHMLANGIDVFGNALRLSMGQEPHIAATRNEAVGVFELFPKQAGIFQGIENEAALRALPSLVHLSIKAKIGTLVGKSSGGYKMCAVVILHNANAVQFAHDLDFLNQQVRVITT